MREEENIEELSDNELKEVLDHGSLKMLDELRARAPAMLAERWGEALNLVEMILVIAQEAGGEFNRQHRPQAIEENDLTFDVLTQLHARACRTASEALALLRSGHADGALSRWRTLHEIAAVAIFIAERGQDVAERYLLHEFIESYRAAEEYQKHCARLGQTPFDLAEMEKFKQEYDRLQSRYGDSYPGKYGWASDALRADDPSFRGRVIFEHIEQAAGISHLRPYYRMASHPIHAGPKGLSVSLGDMKTRSILLAGRSNAGLADPGHCTCISLLQTTIALLNHKSDLETIITVMALNQLVEEAGKAFLTANRRLKEDEMNFQKESHPEGA